MNRTKTDVCGARRKNSLKKNTSQKIIIPVLFFFIADCPHNPESQRPPDGTYCYATRSSATTKNYYYYFVLSATITHTHLCQRWCFLFLEASKRHVRIEIHAQFTVPMHASIACIMSTRNGIDTYDTTQRISSVETSKKHTYIRPYMIVPYLRYHRFSVATLFIATIIGLIFVMTSLPKS